MHPAPPVVDPTARARQRDPAKTVVLGEIPPVRTLDQLELHEPHLQGEHDEEEDRGKCDRPMSEGVEVLLQLHQRNLRAR